MSQLCTLFCCLFEESDDSSDDAIPGKYRRLPNNDQNRVTNPPQSPHRTTPAAQNGASNRPTIPKTALRPPAAPPPTRPPPPTIQPRPPSRPPAYEPPKTPPLPPGNSNDRKQGNYSYRHEDDVTIKQQRQQEGRPRALEQQKKKNDKKSNKVDDSGSKSTHKRLSRFSRLFSKKQMSNEEWLKHLEEQYVMHFLQYEELLYLNEKRKNFPQEEMKRAYKCILKLLLESMLEYKRSLLEVPEGGGTVSQMIDQKEQYKVYGLMLSACIREHVSHGSHEAVKQKIVTQYQFLQGHDGFKIDTSVNKALSMTWSMLTLLPPLLVTKPQCEYSEDILDTNRHTWDEDKSGPPLYYYRPVLVYGNRLHVAVKGLAGNSTSELHS